MSSVYAVTGEHLLGVLNSPKAQRNLGKLGSPARREKAFVIEQELYRPDFEVSRIALGTSDIAAEPPESVCQEDHERYELLKMHSHTDGSPNPSVVQYDETGRPKGDLFGSAIDDGRPVYGEYHHAPGKPGYSDTFHVRPIWGVVSPGEDPTIVLFQQRSYRSWEEMEDIAPDILAAYIDRAEGNEYPTPEAVAEVLEKFNYNAAVLQIREGGFPEKTIETLEPFAFTPRLLPRDMNIME